MNYLLRNKYFYMTLISFFLLLMANTAIADTPVSGTITSNATWTLSESPYIVTNGVLVRSSVTLTIEPGVVVKFNREKALQIDGELIAEGTESNMITFTSNQPYPRPGDWGYILFSDSSIDAAFDGEGNYTGGSIIKYAVVEYAGGLSIDNNGALIVNGASPFINRSRITNNDSRGIEVYNDGNPLISSNTIGHNVSTGGGGGIRVESERAVIIRNNVIHDNATDYIVGTTSYGSGGGILAISGTSDHIIIDNNIVNGNSGYGGGGIHSINTEVTNNIIHNNNGTRGAGGGIKSVGTRNDTGFNVLNNVIINNTTVSTGGGVSIGKGTLTGNIIAYNSVSNDWTNGGKGAGIYVEINAIDVRSNAVIGNEIISGTVNGDSEYGAGIYMYFPRDVTVSHNTVTGNLLGGSNGTGGIYVDNLGWVSSFSNLINNNNIYANTGYEIFYYAALGSVELGAENNYWGTDVETEIQAEIFDWFDNAELEIVDYLPYEEAIRTDSPIPPPQGLTVTKGQGPDSITLTWSASSDSDLDGYRVYWDNDSGFPYANMEDAGNVTSYTISGINGTFRFAVTAYDSDFNESADDPDTIINENQTGGNESWYSNEETFKVGPDIDVSADVHDFGNITIAGRSDPQEFVITNTGNEDLIIGTIDISGTDASSFTMQNDDASGKTIRPLESLTIEVFFSPGSEGLKNAHISIPSNDGDIPDFTIPLTGVGNPPGKFGTVRWQSDGHGFGTPAIGSNGTIYSASQERPPGTNFRTLYAFNPDGTVKWTFQIDGDAYHSTPAIAKDGTIYMGSVYGYKFYAINPDGTEKWVFEDEVWKNGGGWTWSSPSIGEDGIIYFGSRGSGSYEGKVYALHPDGTLKWATPVGTGSTTPAIAADGTIYTGTGSGKLYALYPDGEVKWIFTPPYPNWVSSAPSIGPDGTVYIGKLNYGGRSLHAINPDGTLQWQFDAGGTVNGSPVIGADGTIYAGADDHKLYAINSDGTLKWTFETGAAVSTSPLIGEYGTVYFGSADNNFYALNPHGTMKWSFDTGREIESSPVIGIDGTIYFGSGMTFYAMTCSAKRPADSSWPMYGHDSRHTGNILQDIQPLYPIADAGPDQTVDENDTVILNASGSSQPGTGTILHYRWTQLSGPEAVLSDVSDIQPDFTAPNVGIDAASLLFRLTVMSNSGLQSNDIVEITVEDKTVSSGFYEFGTVEVDGVSNSFDLTISNMTMQYLDIYSMLLSDSQNFTLDLQGGADPVSSIPHSIAPGSSVTVSILFTPSSAGMFSENLIIRTNDPDTPVMEISLNGWGRNDPSGENFIVTIGQDRVFRAFNVDHTEGSAMSDGQNAYSYFEAGSYESGTSEAWAGVRFDVAEGQSGETVSDAKISLTVSYRLYVDFDVLPPEEMGGGSANARLYAWIDVLKEELDYISFIHNRDYEDRSGTITFNHRMSGSQTWTRLYSGQSYEVTADLYTQAAVYAGNEALSYIEATVQEVRIDFPPYSLATATRDLPSHAAVNSDIDVAIAVDVDEDNSPDEIILKEYLPSGWTVNSAVPDYDNYNVSSGEVSWVLTGSDEVVDRSIHYIVHVPGTETFAAVRSFDGKLAYDDSSNNPVTEDISGDKETTLTNPCHAYDTDSNWVIGDFELLDAIDAWAAGKLGDFELLDLIDFWADGSYCWNGVVGAYKAGAHDSSGMCL